jgi:hypothetical protein
MAVTSQVEPMTDVVHLSIDVREVRPYLRP